MDVVRCYGVEVSHPATIHNSFNFSPYQEIVAQQCTTKWLLKWVEATVYRQQLLTIRRIAADGDSENRNRSISIVAGKVRSVIT